MPTNIAGAASGAASGAKLGSMVAPGIGTAIGALLGGAAGLFAGKQKASPQAVYQPVNVQEEQARALAGNLANFDAAATLAAKGNTFSQTEAARLLEQAIPGFGALQKRLLASVGADLDAQTTLPADVQDQIARFAAEKGVTRGTSGNFNAFSLVKDFGFNLVDWQQAARARALNTLSTVYGFAPRVNVMSPMASMVDPTTAIQVASQNHAQQYAGTQRGYDAQTEASNYNRSQLSGLLASVGDIAGRFYGDVQPKTTIKPRSASKPQSAFPKVTDRGLPMNVGPGYA